MTNKQSSKHKSKAVAAFLCLTLGSVGIHRFYLYGKRDPIAWLHFVSLPISILLSILYFNLQKEVTFIPWGLSFMISFLTTLKIGLKSDEKWDLQFNAKSSMKSDSEWPVALICVLAVAMGAITFLFALARSLDLLLTGGSYG
jgi:TM2 domain-containing membrane protein YozV